MTPIDKRKRDLKKMIESFTNSGHVNIVEKLKAELKSLNENQSVPNANRNDDNKTSLDTNEALHKNDSRVV